MRKIASNIFVALFILYFVSQGNDALAREGCDTLDLLCHMTGKGAKDTKDKIDPNKNVEESRKDLDKKKITISKTDTATKIGVYTGMFDFSDDKQAAAVFGLQHQNEDLFRKSFLGKLSPITGGFLTENNAIYLYTGVQTEYELGFLTITPSFAPGYYRVGDGKDLGHALEFKSEVQMTFDLGDSTHLGMSYNHISNASLGTKNPGANSYMFNFLKQF